MLPALTVIIPVIDEQDWLAHALLAIEADPRGVEVVVVDGGSRDRTLRLVAELAPALGARGVAVRSQAAARGRGLQMNAGAAAARGGAFLFLHADTLLPPGAAGAVLDALQQPGVIGGGFRHRFTEPGVGLRLISAGSNLRSRLWGTLYGDQALFVCREAFAALGGFRPLPIFEDADLCGRLRARGRLVVLPLAVRTSARRFLRGGVARTLVEMMRMKLAYSRGDDPVALARRYGNGAGRTGA
jgi:rSAM/selenodomain-associated transferase 2